MTLREQTAPREPKPERHFQTAETLAPRYPEWERFAAVRARMDPEGLFSNAEIDRVLGPVPG